MNAEYETLIVTFSDPIKVLDNMFADADAWGTDTLKGWVEDYESTRFTQINGHTAVITSEYNMSCLKGVAHTLHGYCRHEGILSAWRWKATAHTSLFAQHEHSLIGVSP